MKKHLAALLTPAVLGVGLFGASNADALASFSLNDTNQIFFKNFEVIYRADGTLATNPFSGPAAAPQIGDHFVGIIDVQEIVANGLTTWSKTPTDQFTGYFVQRIGDIVNEPAHGGGLAPGESHLTLETGTFDPFGKLDLAAGEMFKFWVDTGAGATPFEFNGTVPTNGTGLGPGQGAEVTHANLLDDVTKATDGTAWLSFGVGAEGDNADGFTYSHVPLAAAFGGFAGEAWYALMNILNTPNLAFDLLIDNNEVGTDNLTAGNPGYQLAGTSELEQNNDFAGLDRLLGAFVGGAWTGTGDEVSPWYFASNDPALVRPGAIPEPGTVILMGMGLVGLAGIARRQRRG